MVEIESNSIESTDASARFVPREQASETVRRETNPDFKCFKNSFLDNIAVLRNELQSVYKTDTINTDKLYNMTDAIFSGVDYKIDAILYLNAIYSSNNYIVEHCLRVGLLANLFAIWLELDEESVKDATLAGYFHDIGMLEAPSRLIEKEGSLTDDEFEQVKEHIGRGVMMLRNKDIKDSILEAVRSHHERYDGSGYPNGKKGDGIAQLTALVSIVDMYDSMTSNRPYHVAQCPFSVIEYFEKQMIDKLNPKLLYVFLENIPYMYKNSMVRLSDDEKARVVFINKGSKTNPIVRLEKNGQLIDLYRRSDLKIVSLL